MRRAAVVVVLITLGLALACGPPAPRVVGKGSAMGLELVVTERLPGDLTLWVRRGGMTFAWPFATRGARRHVTQARFVGTGDSLRVEGDSGGGWEELLLLEAARMQAGAEPPTLVTCSLEAQGEIPFEVPESDDARLAVLERALVDPAVAVREAAARAVARMGKAAKPVRLKVLDAMTDPDPRVREAAKSAALEIDRPDPRAHSCHAAIRAAARRPVPPPAPR